VSKYRAFKGVERAIAKRLNGDRIGQYGGADVQTDWFTVEVKSRKTLPQWIRDAIAQSKRNAGISQLPIVILHQVGQRHDADLVVMALADFENWFGQAGDSGVVADAEYRAALGNAEALEWLEIMTPDVK
jgi:hypothetical protein